MSTAPRQMTILREIAEGSFGKVYLAELASPEGVRQVAVKLLLAKWNDNDDVMRRTRDEARLLGRIRHDNIVKVEALTAIDGQLAIVMEHLEGVDLRWMIKFLSKQRQIHPRKAAFEIAASVLSAMDAAYHSVPPDGIEPLRVVHRDIKPSNVFVTLDGTVKVLDFGTARATFSQREAVTQMNAFGSRGYMAPERLIGTPDSPAGDVFSLGITLWELLTLDSWGPVATRRPQHDQQVVDSVGSILLQGDLGWVDAARSTIKQMLAWTPEDRPNVSSLADMMTRLAAGAPDASLLDVTAALVPEAHASLPTLDTGDPLVGQVIDQEGAAVAPPVPPDVPLELQRTVQPADSLEPVEEEPVDVDPPPAPEFLPPDATIPMPVRMPTAPVPETRAADRERAMDPPTESLETPAPPTADVSVERSPEPATEPVPPAPIVPAPAGSDAAAPPAPAAPVSPAPAAPAPAAPAPAAPVSPAPAAPVSPAPVVPAAPPPTASAAPQPVAAPPARPPAVRPSQRPTVISSSPPQMPRAPRQPAPTVPPRAPVPRPPPPSRPLVAPVEVVDSVVDEGAGEGSDWLPVALLGVGAALLVSVVVGAAVVVGVLTALGTPEPGKTGPSPVDRGRVIHGGEESKQPRVWTRLRYAGPAGANIQLEGPHGFQAEWSGAADFELGRIRVGSYRATVKVPGVDRIGASFEVVEEAKRCELTLEMDRGVWNGGCER